MKSILTFRWANALSELTGYLCGIALLAATAVTVQAVTARYFLGAPTVWQTELTIYLLMFVTFVGAAYGLKHHAHVGVDLVVEALGPRPQLILRLVTAVLCLGVVLIVFWTSFKIWLEAYEGGFTSSTAWRAPLSVVYTILPVGMGAVALQYVAMIVDGVRGLTGKIPMSEVMLMGHGGEKAVVEQEIEQIGVAAAAEAEAGAEAEAEAAAQDEPRPTDDDTEAGR
ncbi:TRAP transporter small permease subunit [Ornithinicoccus hortensis]|uniref:TRAP-type C4-dicarboxylate transport system permease small subunit n=1 Tax=Ornithinicoccus hortensis TaxID=82346 RepID=A0A542YV95_9MICO|nr:TRAP transporter small permease [Ornithinicoccus hortensis]TQL52002.1 TRAP-type C4-dicarboxylate transport system permease small subunit [Ornithinicoccus hortensis]